VLVCRFTEQGDSASLEDGLKITESDKLAIVTARAVGVSVNELAKRYDVSRQTISSVLAGLKNAKHKDAKEEFDAIVYRNRLRKKAYEGVEAGLDCSDDQYKRGNLGVQVLKGVGDFNGDSINVTFNQFVASIPDDMRDRYILTPEMTVPDLVLEKNGERYIAPETTEQGE
jgi:hypothetical protein